MGLATHLLRLCLAGAVLMRFVFAVDAAEPTRPAQPTRPTSSDERNNSERLGHVVAFTGAKIVVAPGKVLENATLVIRGGRIVAVGAGIAVPPGARVYVAKGRILYPGFIDAHTTLNGEPSMTTLATPLETAGDSGSAAMVEDDRGDANGDDNGDEHEIEQAFEGGAERDIFGKVGATRHSLHPLIAPTVDAQQRIATVPARHASFRAAGFVARLAVPQAGIVRGTSALVATDDAARAPTVLAAQVALHMHLYVPRSPRRTSYPNSPMGAVALARQTLLDAQWLRAVEADASDRGGLTGGTNGWMPNDRLSIAWRDAHRRLWSYLPATSATEVSASANSFANPSAKTSALTSETTLAAASATPLGVVVFDAETEQYLLRAERFAREFGLRAVFRGGGREYRRAAEIAATGRPLILPLAYPSPPRVDTPEAEINAELDDLLHWRLAPENPARMERAGSRIALTSHGLKSPAEFLSAVRKAVSRGWPADAALRALTTTPAELFGVSRDLGTLEPGKLASFLVADDDLFTGSGRVLETWIAGKRWEVVDELPYRLAGRWRLEVEPAIGERSTLWMRLEHGPRSSATSPSEDAAETLRGTLLLAKEAGAREIGLEQLLATQERLTGRFDASPLGVTGVATFSLQWAGVDKLPRLDGVLALPDGRQVELVGKPAPAEDVKSTAAVPKRKDLEGLNTIGVNYPLGAWGRAEPGPPPQPDAIVFRGGTVWTSGPAGVLEDADVWIVRGRIVGVGKRLTVAPNTREIPLRGRHLTPGLIDSHSHIATDGGVNETGQALTCQVRVGDFIDANDVNIHRQLAGGTTAALILHGSANPIGGQGEAIKFRWGLSADGLRFVEAPPTVKFALGENVTTGPDILVPRFPRTRMGVEQFHRQALRFARDYRDRWREWRDRPVGAPPRRDLALDCLAEALDGRRWIHCHAYREDETRTLLEVLEGFQIRVGCLHHVTDGYLMADAILRHGAMVATFTDWWGFKVEALEAVAHNGAFMHRSGIVTSFHSDDRELGRHLQGEAAKALRHGELPSAEALKMVTIAPAKQLRVDSLVGSLEPGKHADLVVWSGSPLAPDSRCEETWIDGRKYFDRQEDLRRRGEVERLKALLTQAVLASGEPMLEAGVDYTTDKESWDRMDRACRGATQGGQRQGRGRNR